MRGFAVPAAVAPAWTRMKELHALYAVQLPSRSAVQQRFSSPLGWRKTRTSAAAAAAPDSTKRRLSARRRSSVGARPSLGSSRRLPVTPAATRAALEASASLDEFHVLSILGRGTFGVVKLARHVATGAAVALKVLDKRTVRELRQEKNVLREQTVHLLLDHACVTTLFATFQDAHALYFVVEYCPGGEVFSLVYDHPGSLDDTGDDDSDDNNGDDNQLRRSRSSSHRRRHLEAADVGERTNQATHDDDEHTTSTTDSECDDDDEKAHAEQLRTAARAAKLELYLANARAKHALRSPTFNGLREPHAAFYLACLLVALEYLHEMNILYRDVKLENMVLDCDGYPKLIDFGLAKPDAASPARARTMVGSMEYMAPEVLERRPYDHRADLWSFGVLMYELLLGETPFYHANAREQSRRIISAPVAFPPAFETTSPDACALLRTLLAKNPSDRPLSFAHVRTSAFFQMYFATPHAWTKLVARQVPAPFVPRLDGPFDTSLFVKAASYEDEGDDLYGY